MTALAGLLRLDGLAAEPDALNALLQAQAARGPDGQRVAVSGPVALGERLLHPNAMSLVRWPQARQPVARLDALTLIWDGRLDNREELTGLLRSQGETVSTEEVGDDRRLLLRLWRCFGTEVLPRLLGDFAFAVWDAQQQQLVLARDAMGARPFYYTIQSGFFALASEDEALLTLPGVSPAPNLERLAYALCPAFQDFEWSMSWLAQVRILMPGTALCVGADGSEKHWTWWHWEVCEPARFTRDEEVLAAFDTVIVQAVHDRTRDLDAIGLITSGGMDTATVAVAASRVRAERPLRLIATLQDDPTQCIESRAIETLAETLHGELVDLRVPSMRGPLLTADVAAFYQRPHPVDDGIALIGMMCLVAQRTGQRVLLHGATGDLSFWAPDDTFFRTVAERGWCAAWAEACAAQQHHTYVQGCSPLHQLLRSLYADGMPPSGKAIWRRVRRWQRGPALNWVREAGNIGLRLGLSERMRAASLRDDRATWVGPRLVREHLQALFPIGVMRGLEGYERVAGRYGVELRDPLADRRVIAFCLALPLHWRTREGWTKYIARRWASAVLPEVCVWRSDKTHLGHFLDPGPAGLHPPVEGAVEPDGTVAEALAAVEGFLAVLRAMPASGPLGEAAGLHAEAGEKVRLWLRDLARRFPRKN